MVFWLVLVIIGDVDPVGDVDRDGGDGGGGGGPSTELSKDVCLVEKENDARVQEHFAVGHHVEQLNMLVKMTPAWWDGGFVHKKS